MCDAPEFVKYYLSSKYFVLDEFSSNMVWLTPRKFANMG